MSSESAAQRVASTHLVYSQTGYSMEEVEHKLIDSSWDALKVIREYHAPATLPNTPPPPTSVNQKIYKELRSFMDSVYSNTPT